jgi:hypothetical protein
MYDAGMYLAGLRRRDLFIAGASVTRNNSEGTRLRICVSYLADAANVAGSNSTTTQ